MGRPSDKNLYLIALLPDEALRGDIKGLKEEMKSRYGASHALKSPAHITLQMPFRWAVSAELSLIRALEEFARTQEPFGIDLSGFDCFAPRVLFVKVTPHLPIVSLQARLREQLEQKLGFPPGKEGTPFHPHMTIATRDLSEACFQKAWEEFSERKFRASFTADRLYLLRHTGKAWDIHRTFTFGP
jgi:2'-5' RNA ligase